MRAIQSNIYGQPEKVLKMVDVAKPIPKEGEILIKIHATTINDYDWSHVRGKPFVYRLMFGLFKPKYNTAGMELSGTVEGLGTKATKFKVGDPVFGDISEYGFGTFAEYISITENAVLKKPLALEFEEAAALPHAATLAIQGLEDLGQLKEGQKVLINGGGGGVGSLGVQLAKLKRCEVTGVDSKEKLNMMKSIGYDHVLDYKKVDFTKNTDKYDLILDCKTSKNALSYLSVLRPEGRYVTIGGSLTKLIGVLFWGKILALFSSKKLQILSLKPNVGLERMAALLEQNKIKCIIDGPYPLEETARLIQYFGKGGHQGKIVIRTI